jgi:acyl dehydratase
MTGAETVGEKTLYYEDINIGDRLPEISKGPMSPAHIMRWSASIENWHRIHYDQSFATEHEGLPSILVNGSWKQHVLAQLLKDWVGPGGWVFKINFQYRGLDIKRDTVTAFGEVVEKQDGGEHGLVRCEIGIRNDRGLTATVGEGVVAVPYAARSQEISLPFVSAEGTR